MRRRALALALGAAAAVAQAHDTWFTALPPTARGQLMLALGTGTAFPRYEVAVAPAQMADSGCIGDGVRERPLREGADLSLEGLGRWFAQAAQAPPVLVLRTGRPVSPVVSVSCWVRLVPIDIEIGDATVEVYLDEIQAPQEVRARWSDLKARGVRWQETYVKHARIEVDGEADRAALATPALPAMGMDLRLEGARRPVRVGDTVRVQLRRDGRPLQDQPLQLLGDGVPMGLWRRTDADGRIEVRLSAAGRWLLRGTEVRAAADGSDRWDSRFVTLAFEVKP